MLKCAALALRDYYFEFMRYWNGVEGTKKLYASGICYKYYPRPRMAFNFAISFWLKNWKYLVGLFVTVFVAVKF